MDIKHGQDLVGKIKNFAGATKYKLIMASLATLVVSASVNHYFNNSKSYPGDLYANNVTEILSPDKYHTEIINFENGKSAAIFVDLYNQDGISTHTILADSTKPDSSLFQVEYEKAIRGLEKLYGSKAVDPLMRGE